MFTFARPWSDIDSLGKLKISKSSYIYVVVVPVLSRIFENVSSPISIIVGGAPFLLDLSFPFTWYTFYFGALCIAVGSAIYTLCCPAMIRLYPNYVAFLTAGKDDSFIYKSADSFLDDHKAETLLEELRMEKPMLTLRNTTQSTGERGALNETINYSEGANPAYLIAKGRAFNRVFNSLNSVRRPARWTATLSYYSGLSAFISIIGYNAFLVGRSFLS
jgi:hypothetical protein